MTILVTGGSGFLGSNLVHQELAKRDEEIILFDIRPPRGDPSGGKVERNVRFVQGDVTVLSNVVEVVGQNSIDSIFHLAALLPYDAERFPPFNSYALNFISTLNVLEASRLSGVKKVIFPSSNAAYEHGKKGVEPAPEEVPMRPETSYGISKLSGELWGLLYTHRYGIDFRAVRFPSVIGPGRDAPLYVTQLMQKAALGEPYVIEYEPNTRWPVLYIKDAAKALALLFYAQDPPARVYNFAGVFPTALEMAEEVKKVVPEADVRFEPKSHPRPVPIALDDSKARRELGWRPDYTLDRLVLDFISSTRSLRQQQT